MALNPKQADLCGEPESRRAVATHAKGWAAAASSLRYVLVPCESMPLPLGPTLEGRRGRTHDPVRGAQRAAHRAQFRRLNPPL